jgi:hypothetical protein
MQVIEIMRRIRRAENPQRASGLVELAIGSVGIAAVCLAPALAAAEPLPSRAGQPRVAWGYVADRNQYCGDFCFINAKKGGVYTAYLGTGSYEVEVNGLGPSGPDDVQVSAAQGGGFAYCMTAGWDVSHPENATVDIIVDCYDAAGNPIDDEFAFLYQSRPNSFGSAAKGIAFLWADQPTEASYTPNLSYQYNSTGAANTMVRNGTGSYTASIPGLTKKGGNVQVTAYGSVPARCKVSSWSSSESGTSANVLCFDGTGAAADEMFTLAYTIGVPMGLWDYEHTRGYPKDGDTGARHRMSPVAKPTRGYPKDGDTGAYAWADKPDHTKIYTPPRAFNYNGFGTGGLTVAWQRTGLYAVTLPGVKYLDAASVLVTANGDGNTTCSAGGYIPVDVNCFDQNGNPVDSEFSVLFQTDEKK